MQQQINHDLEVQNVKHLEKQATSNVTVDTEIRNKRVHLRVGNQSLVGQELTWFVQIELKTVPPQQEDPHIYSCCQTQMMTRFYWC